MATINDLGVDGNGIPEPKMKHRWRLNFQGGAFGVNAESLRVNARSIERPKLQYNEMAVNRYNSISYRSGRHEWQEIQAVFGDDLGGRVTRAFQDQSELQQNIYALAPSPRLPSAISAANFKFAVVMEMLDGDDTALECWILEGVFLKGLDFDGLDYGEAATELTINVTLRYDHARQDIRGQHFDMNVGSGNC